MTLKCFESANYFAFLFNKLALDAYMHTDTQTTRQFLSMEKMIFTNLITDSFWDRRQEEEA